MKKLATLPLAALISLGGCFHDHEVNFEPSAELQARAVGVAPMPVFYPDGLSAADEAIFRDAYGEVVGLLADETFRARLNALTIRAGCLSDVRVSGAVVLDDLENRTIPVRIRKRNSPGITTATTDIVERWMNIDEDRFDNWHQSDAAKAAMINTLIHEMTHLVPYDGTPPGQNWFYKYYDQDYDEAPCSGDRLVSYTVGDLAEEVWLANRRAAVAE